MISSIFVAAILIMLFSFAWKLWLIRSRANYIRAYSFPPGLYEKLRKRRPELSVSDCEQVGQALRQFFLAYLFGRRRFVSMPSQVADDLWHEMILYTRYYQSFCRRAFGGFLHHTPAVVLAKNKSTNTGLRRVWWFSCKEEKIDPRNPSHLPILFALDKMLNISDGFFYTVDCKALQRDGAAAGAVGAIAIYCGGDFSSTSFDGSTDGFGCSGNSDGSGDSGGCGGGCGGD
jgi:hypothetical protein